MEIIDVELYGDRMAVTRKKKNTKSKGAIKEEGKSLNGKSGAQKDHSKLNIKGGTDPRKTIKAQ